MNLDFGVISQALHPLLTTFPNLIKREWPERISMDNGLQLLLHGVASLTANTYRTVLWIVAERPEYPERRLEYVLSVSPLTRSILDQVMTVCFLSEDVQGRALLYHKSSWRELYERHQRESERYEKEPNWERRLASNTQLLTVLAGLANLTDAEKKDPSKCIKYWPNPGKMAQRVTTDATRQFLEYLEDWFYRELSQETHLTGPGLIALAPALILDIDQREVRETLESQRSLIVLSSVTLMLALLSEIQGILRFSEMSAKLMYLWGILGDFWRDPKELYERRYQALLKI